jgi:hypothetical protein
LTIRNCYHPFKKDEDSSDGNRLRAKRDNSARGVPAGGSFGRNGGPYGPQIGLKLKVVGGEHDSHTFMDYANLDEDTGQVKQGSKAWSIFEACLGRDFHKRSGVSLESLVGKQFVGQVAQTRTGSRNKVEFGTIGPVPPEEVKENPKPHDGTDDDSMFDDLPF